MVAVDDLVLIITTHVFTVTNVCQSAQALTN